MRIFARKDQTTESHSAAGRTKKRRILSILPQLDYLIQEDQQVKALTDMAQNYSQNDRANDLQADANDYLAKEVRIVELVEMKNQPLLRRLPDKEKRRTFSNKLPEKLETEKITFNNQMKVDNNSSFIVNYKQQPRRFRKMIKENDAFIWVYTVDEELIIGSRINSQHPVVADGKEVLCAGEGINLNVSDTTKISMLKQELEMWESHKASIKSIEGYRPEDFAVYDEPINYAKEEIRKVEENRRSKARRVKDEVKINLKSGHYHPTLDMCTWQIALYAWRKAGYKVDRDPNNDKFIPNELKDAEKVTIEKPTKNLPLTEGPDPRLIDPLVENFVDENQHRIRKLRKSPLPIKHSNEELSGILFGAVKIGIESDENFSMEENE